MSNRSRLLGVVLYTMPVLFAAVAAHAQDTNYWTLQYGTRGELLGGTVVGSAVDLSATFYNPGSLALVKDPKTCLLYTSDAADERSSVDLGGRRIIKKKNT